MKESTYKEWMPIKGYETMYMISKDGCIKSLAYKYVDKNGIVYTKKERILKNKNRKDGYISVYLHRTKKKYYLLHRLIAKTFIKNTNNEKEVNHKNGNKKDNTISNLEWCNKSYNIKHAYSNQLREKLIGRNNNKSKLVLNTQNGVYYESCNEASKYSLYSPSTLRGKLNGSKLNNTNLIYC